MTGRVLIAGVGNIFLGDDGFGVEVAKRLAAIGLPGGAEVADYGISGMHLAYDLAEGYDTVILIDAAPRGGEPGTVTVIDVAQERQRAAAVGGVTLTCSRLFDAHGMQPDVVLGMLDVLGAGTVRVLVVGCEPASLDGGMELSEPVAKAVDQAVEVVVGLVAEAGRNAPASPGPTTPASPGPAAPASPAPATPASPGPAAPAHGSPTSGEGVSHVPRHTG